MIKRNLKELIILPTSLKLRLAKKKGQIILGSIIVMKERVVLQILFSIALAFSVYIIGEWGAQCIFHVHSIDLFWGITLRLALLVFFILAITIGVIPATLNKHICLVLSIMCVIILSFLIGSFTIRPYRTLLLCISGVIGITLPIILV